MRKVTKQIKEAFDNQKARKVGNTHTDGKTVWLHGNAIVKRDENGNVFATLAGWNTPTTRERVNGITGMGFHQHKHEPCLNGKPINSTDWFAVN